MSRPPREHSRWRWRAAPTFPPGAPGSRPSGPTTSNAFRPGRSWRPSPNRPGSIPTPELSASGARALRVGLDIRALTDDATGVGRYIRALMSALKDSHGVELMSYRDAGPPVLGPQFAMPLR